MLKYNNTHIFTGYLKQLLSSFNLPTCKIYTQEFAQYLDQHGYEDPRILRSFNTIGIDNLATRIGYLKNDKIYYYFWNRSTANQEVNLNNASWNISTEVSYDENMPTSGLTKTLNSSGNTYDVNTHEYLGDYLRFLRDYSNINLMSLYNCFNDKIYNNIYFDFDINPDANPSDRIPVTFNVQEPGYRIYAIPVKLFAEYTIAIDCPQSVEMFCGLYNTSLNTTSRARRLAARTYQKINRPIFNQPFLYDKLTIKNWPTTADFIGNKLNRKSFTHWDIAKRESDFKLFIKVPISCKSSIVILEGDYRTYNNATYVPVTTYANENYTRTGDASSKSKTTWVYQQNHSITNFDRKILSQKPEYVVKPISRLQLLEFNTGESYPFADRLIEYLSGSAITSIDDIPDNIRRAQRVMEQNKNYFAINGIWENKMQNIIYDYIMVSGPIELNPTSEKLEDKRLGYHKTLGHNYKSTLYDVLGYIDKDVEKWYSSWKNDGNKAQIINNIQNVDIYNQLFDIK